MATSGHFVALKAVIEALVAPPAEEWARFQGLFEPQTLPAGEYFIRAGDLSTRICFINAGLLRWERLGRLLTEQLYIKKEQREAEFLLDDAPTRYRNFQKQYPGLEDRLPQYHVASYLGITPVALSRIRNAESG